MTLKIIIILILCLPFLLSLKPSDLDWQPCNCNNMTLGLSDGDIMKLNMFLSSDSCQRRYFNGEINGTEHREHPRRQPEFR